MESVWIFVGAYAKFPGGVFLKKEDAARYIERYKLSGTLSLYPMGEGIYDWAIRNNFFSPKNENQQSPAFIQTFSDASLEHYHYEDGIEE